MKKYLQYNTTYLNNISSPLEKVNIYFGVKIISKMLSLCFNSSKFKF